MARPYVYRVLRADEWRQLLAADEFAGNSADKRDGYIHLSAHEQVESTIKRHFEGATDLVVLEIDAAVLGSALRWEVSRDDQLFPHLYGKLRMSAVLRTIDVDVFRSRDGELSPAAQLHLLERAFAELLRKKPKGSS